MRFSIGGIPILGDDEHLIRVARPRRRAWRATMAEKTYWDSFKAESENVISQIKGLIHEGNVRRVVIQHQGRTVAEFPLTAGVVGAVLAPVLAAIGALVALLQDCTIQVERTEPAHKEGSETAAR